jgi:hypothetical protein
VDSRAGLDTEVEEKPHASARDRTSIAQSSSTRHNTELCDLEKFTDISQALAVSFTETMRAGIASEMSVNIDETERRSIPQYLSPSSSSL